MSGRYIVGKSDGRRLSRSLVGSSMPPATKLLSPKRSERDEVFQETVANVSRIA